MIFSVERHAGTKLQDQVQAPGKPGTPARWTTGAKTAVGTAISSQSRIWFTISHGILNEVYFPSIDQANTRSLSLVVTDGGEFFSHEEWDADHHVTQEDPSIPYFRVETRCKRNRYEIRKEFVPDSERDVLLVKIDFKPLNPDDNLRLFVVLDPHVADAGDNNDGWVGRYKGIPMLFATREKTAIALCAQPELERISCGYIGVSDALTDLRKNRELRWQYTNAPGGNVGLGGEIAWSSCAGSVLVALGFGGHAAEAGQQARAGLLQDFENIRKRYIENWRKEQQSCRNLKNGATQATRDLYRVSAAVLQIHESKRFPGAMVAGLTIPWGFSRGDKDIGGYHVIWPRDMVQAAMGKVACGDVESARRTLFYLECTQEANGKWSQNMWLDGTPHWNATQMDGPSYGILLADLLRRMGGLGAVRPWPMVRKAAEFLVRNGPVTEQERWEENEGYSPNTMAVEVAALLAAADFADEASNPDLAEFFRLTADAWNDAIDELTYCKGTDLARKHGVEGYYVRIGPPDVIRTGLDAKTMIRIKNKPDHDAERKAVDIISPGMLALVRYGLRAADDPRVRNTVKILDATLKKQVSTGPIWYRYTDDGYGEHADGSPFNKTGIGRGWPLLAGERGHYEIARENFAEAERIRETMEKQTSPCGLLPEQVWDADDIPEHELFNGHPTGSGMPLVWAHAEYIRLLRSLEEKHVWDMPPQTVARYQQKSSPATFQIWTFLQQRARVSRGKDLRLDVLNGARVRWTADDWQSAEDIDTKDAGVIQYALLRLCSFQPGTRVQFTFYWLDSQTWEGCNFEVSIV